MSLSISKKWVFAALGLFVVSTLRWDSKTLTGPVTARSAYENVHNTMEITELTKALPEPQEQSTRMTSPDDRFHCADSLTEAIGKLPPVFIFMPAKAGGSSIKHFARRCYEDATGVKIPPIDNFVNRKAHYLKYLLNDLQVPKVTASHLYSPTPLEESVRYSSRDTVFIYIYRKETDRLMSGIRQMASHTCTDNPQLYKSRFGEPIETRQEAFGANITRINNTKTCTLNEESFVTRVIQKRAHEVGFSVPSQLTCNVWSELEETGPDRFFFVHYSALDEVQATLASHYCPNVGPIRTNVAGVKPERYMLRMRNQSLVDLDDWIEAKKDHIEFALQMSGGGGGAGSCKRKTRVVEDNIFGCDSGILQWIPR
uniref:Sulfotransferase domain-containing protein n=1 Tax=Amphora coffeiformis TaxID=265554 RepID=A0A6S8IUQ6_9STRA